ncbi:MAG: formate dehydrogenase accessory sulfurtransferase FdhD [Candidatus Latescibacterota bacterium]|nr:MAG: formate dehydrogenase accessory sulfurtransferase FdhD [Candidatus Latescibacterota bacterium]
MDQQQLNEQKNKKIHHALRSINGGLAPGFLELIAEEPLLIRIDEKPYSVVMRTPGEEAFHAVGFCLGEGIIDAPDDLDIVGYDEHLDPNVIDIWLQPERRKKIPRVLRRRSFVSQTSCGICGKQLIEDLYQKLSPAENGLEIDLDRIFDCINMLSERQRYYQTTRGSHAALVLDDQLRAIAFAEDIGRHNALDKAIGKALMDGQLPNAKILVLSSRNSYELVQKAARAQLQMMISYSRPTDLAVEMAKALNMTLVFPDKGSELAIVCGDIRVKTTNSNVAYHMM